MQGLWGTRPRPQQVAFRPRGSRDQEAEPRLPQGAGDGKGEELEQFRGYGPQHLEKNTWKRTDGVLTRGIQRGSPAEEQSSVWDNVGLIISMLPRTWAAPVLGCPGDMGQSKAGPLVPHPFSSAHLLIPNLGGEVRKGGEGLTGSLISIMQMFAELLFCFLHLTVSGVKLIQKTRRHQARASPFQGWTWHN